MDPFLSIEELAREFDTPNLTDWKLFSQNSSLSCYRRTHQKLIYYKFFHHLPDISPDVLHNVVLDVEYRVVWDKYLKEGRKISDGDKNGIYWLMSMPLFMSNRDYTFVQEQGEYDIGDRHFYYASTHCEEFKNELPRKKIIRIENCQSQTIICTDGAKGSKTVVLYSEDPRGSFPKAAWSWAAKFGIPLYAKLTHNACKTYPQWIKDKNIIVPNVIEDDADSAAAETAAAAAAASAIISPEDSVVDNDDSHNEQEQDQE
ncbi:unnamed protein product [Rotaria magnacalcarata]|uniref:Phosphatidylcholine transfer protein n=2 Tax=Rotaria magnacalcarata TaxID=392030 RepID=A0A818XJZ1_9BILA|nr:unnamed protein product [Rotaria magnacalcarata]CAF3741671.1 unnamed protein product [Rotaria magnacalcarata]